MEIPLMRNLHNRSVARLIDTIRLLYNINLHVRVDERGYTLVETRCTQEEVLTFGNIHEVRSYLEDLLVVEEVIHETD